jgi:predicted SnoaL-like aldol condensation-catalyzing enzyme
MSDDRTKWRRIGVIGKVVEHWDVMQEEVPAGNTASGNAMFTTT